MWSLTLSGRFSGGRWIIFSAGFWGAALHTPSLRPILRVLLSAIRRASSRNILRAKGLWMKSGSSVLKESAWDCQSPKTAGFIPGWRSSLPFGS